MTPEQLRQTLAEVKNGVVRKQDLPRVEFALRLALRVMDEPSEGMIEDGDAADNEPYHRASCSDIFKAMRDQLLQEVRDDTKL